MNIDDVLDMLMDFYPWLNKKTGLEDWQLLIIALSSLFLLILFLIHQRKSRVKSIHAIHRTPHSDLIGINLTDKDTSYNKHNKKESAFLADDEEEQQSWGQTTKEWRHLTEKIRQLQHEISKYKRSEKYLKEQITQLKDANVNLLTEISKDKPKDSENKITRDFQAQPKEISSASGLFIIPQMQTETIEDTAQKSSEQSETSNVPLDIKELKAIAELAKRLQIRSQQNHDE